MIRCYYQASKVDTDLLRSPRREVAAMAAREQTHSIPEGRSPAGRARGTRARWLSALVLTGVLLTSLVRIVTLIAFLLLMVVPSWAAEDSTELAKKTQNPVADLISVPLQNNFNFGMGPKNVTQYVLNVQPVIPFKLSEDWNLITRTILPIINQPSIASGVESAFGLGDLNPSFFLSPGKPGALIWGVGPTFTLPTATDNLLGSGKWSMGPTAVALTIQGPWVLGALAN